MTSDVRELEFDRSILTDQYLANPYPSYAELREQDPVHWSPRLNAWILTRYSDVYLALRDPRLISGKRVETYAEGIPPEDKQAMQPLWAQMSKWIGNMDPPDHTRLRRLVNVAFTPRLVELLRPRIEALVNGLLDEADRQGMFDFMSVLAYPLPAIVIAEMLGVPVQDQERFIAWSDAMVRYGGTGRPDVEVARQASYAAGELSAFFQDLALQRRVEPRDDLISALIRAEDEGEAITEQELLSMCGFLIIAGHETTMALLGNGLLALLRHREQFVRLANDERLISSAVEECLRYDSPIQHQTRVAAEDLRLGDQMIRKGQRVMPFLGAANRDPQQFPEPDRFDIGRAPNKHLAFGFGPHYCLGAPLARLEASIAFPAIARRFPDLRLMDIPEALRWRVHTSNRNPQSLSVSVR